jgi:small nuclear ribonucleoprotein (snRNP)-like protein
VKYKRKALFGAVFALLLSTQAYSEIFFLKNGEIYIGEIRKYESGNLIIINRGKEFPLRSSEVIWYVDDISTFFGLPVIIELNDGSAFKGAVIDYDEEIGIFISIEFGEMAIPNSVIKGIYDPAQRAAYLGPAFSISLEPSFGFLLPSGQYSGGTGWGMDSYCVFRVNALRGLYAGLNASYLQNESSDPGGLSLSCVSLRPALSYNFLDSRMKKGFLGLFSPMIGVGAGPAYAFGAISAADPPPYDFTLSAFVMAGIDIKISKGFRIRLQAKADAVILQTDVPIVVSVGGGIAYER